MSCLFDSFSILLDKKFSSNDIRQLVCDYLEQNPKLMDDKSLNQILCNVQNVGLSKYVREMRKENTWGGAIEIKSFCEIFNYKVLVYIDKNNRIERKPIEFIPSCTGCNESKYSKVIKIKWNGSHYEPLI